INKTLAFPINNGIWHFMFADLPVGTVLDGKGYLRLCHVQAIGAYLAVEPKMPRGALAPVVGVGKAQHRQYGVPAVAHRELGAIGKDKVHAEGAVRAVDGWRW